MMIAPRVEYDGRQLVRTHGVHIPTRIVLHSTESHDAKGIRDLAGIALFWFGVSWGPGAHVGVDAEGYSALYADDIAVTYHVLNRNTKSLGLEQIGFARFTLPMWRARRSQLDEVSHWLAYWSAKHDIPLKIDVEHGVSTHQMQSKKFGGSHWDPGFGYPLGTVIGHAREIRDAAQPAKPKPKREPDPFWTWLAWKLGEGDFLKFGPSNRSYRPKSAPERVPDEWWTRWERFMANRVRAERGRRDG